MRRSWDSKARCGESVEEYTYCMEMKWIDVVVRFTIGVGSDEGGS